MNVWTTKQTAEYLELSEGRVKKMARDGVLAAKKIGRDWTFKPADVRDLKATPRPAGRPPSEFK